MIHDNPIKIGVYYVGSKKNELILFLTKDFVLFITPIIFTDLHRFVYQVYQNISLMILTSIYREQET